jgi:hypothetical protein
MGIIASMLESGAPGLKFETPGTSYKGTVVEIDERQGTDFDTDVPLWWGSDGKPTKTNAPGLQPYMVPIFTLQVQEPTEEDDGLRSLWLRSNLYTAVVKAIKEAFPRQKPEDSRCIGGVLSVRFDKLGEKKGKLPPAKLYSAKFEPRQIVDSEQYSEGNPPPPTDKDNW